jgi:hypothetical protein
LARRSVSEHHSHGAIAGVAIAVLLCLWGALASYGVESDYHQQYRDPYLVSAQFTRFGPALSAIPENAEIGYITDTQPGSAAGSAMFLSAQYVLAPRLLKRGAAPALVLGNFTRPADFAAAGRSQGLRQQQDFGNGVVLFRRDH